jgi:hypothetical protein
MTKNKTMITTTFAMTFLAITLLMISGPSVYAGPGPDAEVCEESNSVQICKSVFITDENGGEYEVGDVLEFAFAIEIHTSSTTLINPVVKDRLGGDLMSEDGSLVSPSSLECTLGTPDAGSNPHGKKKGGATEKEFLDCEGLEIPPESWETILFDAKTDINPGQQNQQDKGKEPKNEFTSCGEHEINSGASLKFWFFDQNPETDEPIELKTPAISVDIVCDET